MYVDASDKKFAQAMSRYENLGRYTTPVKRMKRKLVGREAEMRSVSAAMERAELSNVILLASAGSGKLLPLDTPIPTPTGWTTMGELERGDEVLGRDGKPTTVTFTSEVDESPRLFELEFSDGTRQVACVDHQWLVCEATSERVMTTGDMLREGIVTPDGGSRFSIRLAEPLDLPEASLPVDPYVLGAWLAAGDVGLDGSARLVSADIEVVRAFEASGYPGRRIVGERGKEVADTYAFEGLGEALAGIGMGVGKHVATEYLRASHGQRLALLQGIMDAAGSVGEHGEAEVSLVGARLADDACELVRTLGITICRREAERGGHHRMALTTTQRIFRLPRKDERHMGAARPAQRHIWLVGIRPVDSVAGKCIQVDNEDHVYLCGRNFLPTHNTALVQGLMMRDPSRVFLETNLSQMIADAKNPDEIGNMLKRLFDEASQFGVMTKHEVVLFMDEFHQIVQLSAAAVEALKPLLADSATRGIRVIAATTYEEFRKYISDNQPLVERLQRINVPEPDRETTVEILKGMAERYGVADDIIGNALYETIYDVTQRHIPANAQPRKSILVLDAMVGWHRAEHRKFNNKLLADVIFESEGINIAFSVDPSTIRDELDRRVLAQTYATRVVEERLQLCVAGLNDQSRPQSSFLLCGPTGVGKQIANSTPVPAVSPENGSLIYIRHGDLKVGDTIFDAHGRPTHVLGTFPQKSIPMYRVTFSDGRVIEAGDNHLWAVYSAKLRRAVSKEGKHRGPYVMTTQEIVDAGVVSTYDGDTRRHLKWFIPMNGAVDTAPLDVPVDPYVVGAFVGNGCLTAEALTFSGDDEFVVDEISRLICAEGHRMCEGANYSWCFHLTDDTAGAFGSRWSCQGQATKCLQTETVFGDMPELFGVKSAERRIPARYMAGSTEQRWALVQGLFDTDGSVSADDRVRVSYSTFSEDLAKDVVQLLFSLGISSRYTSHYRERECEDGTVRTMLEHTVRVRCAAEDKPRLFRLPRKRERAERAVEVAASRKRVKRFDMVGIESIEPIGVDDAQCIYVDNDEHLYQVGQFVVTHNTELTKQLSRLLFGDSTRSLIRMDMAEYANADSLERFRMELTARVWEHPYSIVLLDEVEKACPEVTRVLLSVLDDARLSDRNGREVSFLNCYFVLTTNAGTEIYRTIAQYESDDSGDGSFLARYDRLIRRSLTASTGGVKFPPELLGRMDCIVPFQPLSYNTMRQICVMRLKELRQKLLAKYGIDMSVEGRVVTYLVEDSLTNDSDAGGARAVMSKLESEVTTGIARFVNMHPDVRNIHVEMEGELASENKARISSDACVKIKGVVG